MLAFGASTGGTSDSRSRRIKVCIKSCNRVTANAFVATSNLTIGKYMGSCLESVKSESSWNLGLGLSTDMAIVDRVDEAFV